MVIFILGFIGPKKVVSEKELNAMVAHSLKDIPSDAEISDIDDAEVEVMFQKIFRLVFSLPVLIKLWSLGGGEVLNISYS